MKMNNLKTIREAYRHYQGESMGANAVLSLCNEVEHLRAKLKKITKELEKTVKDDPCDNDGQGCPWPDHINNILQDIKTKS